MHITAHTNVPVDTHPDYIRVAMAIADAFGLRVVTEAREERNDVAPDNRVLVDCKECGDLHY